MVCFIAHKRQCTIVGMIVLLMLLANLLPALNPALAQSCPTPTVTLSASSGGPGDDVIRIKGEGWVPDGSVGLTVSFNVDNVPVPDSSGTWEINGIVDFPALPGTYALVFSENWDGCELSVTMPFTINEPTISLGLTEGPPGTEVTVTGSGWPIDRQGDIDIVSIQFADSGNEVAQATVDNESNFTTTFTVPADAAIGEQKVTATVLNGLWQTDAIFRVMGEGSVPPAATPTPAPPERSYSLSASPSTVAFGGSITVNWTAPADHADNDWIAFYKVGNDNNNYITFQRPTPGATSGSLTFTAPNTADPTTAGQYEFRYLPKAEFTDVARSNTVTLGSGYTLTARPQHCRPRGHHYC